ncbi:MAG: glycosyltransferase family 39 protein, partial [Saprospiraceae bacterium]|nr:glycosyltransferase family 39 protein [Saprospiraceae bacterium]
MSHVKGMPVWWWLAGGILLANLLVLNDHNSFFSPVETEVMLAIRQTAPTWQDSPVESLYRLAMAGGDLLSWWARLPAAVLFVLALAGFYWLARPLLGKGTGGLLLLALGSSLLAPNLAKTVCGDNWLLLVHGLALLASIRFLKDPKGKWLALTGGLIV